jgi:hypothetical protein
VKAGAAGGERALIAGGARVKERRVAGYRMSSADAQRCCDGGRGGVDARGDGDGRARKADGGGVVGLGRRMEVARRLARCLRLRQGLASDSFTTTLASPAAGCAETPSRNNVLSRAPVAMQQA